MTGSCCAAAIGSSVQGQRVAGRLGQQPVADHRGKLPRGRAQQRHRLGGPEAAEAMLRQPGVNQQRRVTVRARRPAARCGSDCRRRATRRQHLRGRAVKPRAHPRPGPQRWRRSRPSPSEMARDRHRDLESLGRAPCAPVGRSSEGCVERGALRRGQARRAETQRANQLMKARKRQMRLGLHAGRAQHREAAFARQRSRRGQQAPGLADSRLAGTARAPPRRRRRATASTRPPWMPSSSEVSSSISASRPTSGPRVTRGDGTSREPSVPAQPASRSQST